jgi:hypothetical protein
MTSSSVLTLIPVVSVSQITHAPNSHSQMNTLAGYVMTDSMSASLSRCQAAIWGSQSDFYYCQTAARCWCGAPSLMRGWVYSLQLLLGLASTVILRSNSCMIHDHILLSQIWDSSSLEAQVPVFMCPGNRLGQLHPKALSLWISCLVHAHYTALGGPQ